ncbi:putative membrane protein [Erysiphe neolycopersici]|uniref:Putative membrane protein n=1 Tax=Erysiphe neolycopersici TaxID=212602 RepID=A0A420H940_9PEZI|nr:putative membrane protein [Erysiphe neolycopersici]
MSEQNMTRRCNKSEESDTSKWERIWLNNQGAILILIAEGISSAMDAMARYLQQGERGIHTFQIIFARMSGTFVLSFIYLWWKSVPHFPLGIPKVRPLLILRALFGFGGIYCIYYSVHYLPLAEATIFRFLVPLLTAFSCSIFLHQPFTRKDFFLSILALVGIIIIAHPASIMGKSFSQTGTHYNPIFPVVGIKSSHADATTPLQRIIAVIVAIIGILGGAGAFTTIRLIGKRAHALHSVIYYSFFCTVSSTFFLLVLPGINFKKPQGLEWFMLLLLGLLGFGVQFLLTKGLQLDPSNKATSMLYTQVLYAILFDWLIWKVLPDKWGIIGGTIVIGSTLWSALSKPNIHSLKEPNASTAVDEESPLLGDSNEAGNDGRR